MQAIWLHLFASFRAQRVGENEQRERCNESVWCAEVINDGGKCGLYLETCALQCGWPTRGALFLDTHGVYAAR